MTNMNESEASALLVVAIQKKKIDTYEYMKYLSRLSNEGLIQSGWRNGQADAVLQTLKRAEIYIEKMIRKHEREYP
jgi:hypothetical protein